MLDSIYCNPTRIIFGRDKEYLIGKEVAKYAKKILLLYGQKSIKASGLYTTVVPLLYSNNVDIIEMGGICPNPKPEPIDEAITLCREQDIRFILAVGGGSVIDSAKAISIGIPYKGDFLDLFRNKTLIQDHIDVASIITLFGTGSAANGSAAITNRDKTIKLGISHPALCPTFSIINPALTFTVPWYQIACGIADTMSHLFERYFTPTPQVECSEQIGEGLLRVVMKNAKLLKQDLYNYDLRAELFWASCLANNEMTAFGVKQDTGVHPMSHSIGAQFGHTHGALTAILTLAWMKYVYHINMNKFEQLAERVFKLTRGSREEKICNMIKELEAFYIAMGLPTTLRQLGMPDGSRFENMAHACIEDMPSGTIGNFLRLAPKNIEQIFTIAF